MFEGQGVWPTQTNFGLEAFLPFYLLTILDDCSSLVEVCDLGSLLFM